MHRLIKIRIVRDLDHLEERVRRWMDNVFELQDMSVFFRPHADFYETSQGCVVRLDVAGVAKEDLSITLVGQELIIRGRRLPPPPQGLRRFIHLEMGFGNFERRFAVPIPVDLRGVEAQYLDGILEVQLPRKKPRQVQITVKEAPDRE